MKRLTTARKFIVGGVAAVSVAGATLAFANSLSVTSDTLGSGTSTVDDPAPCAPDVSYETTWNATDLTFDVTKVTVTDADCNGLKVQAALVGTGASLWSSGTAATVASGTASWTIAPGTVDAEDVTDAYATVNG